jgi:hypothetical protein
MQKLTVDQTLADFRALLQAELDSRASRGEALAGAGAPETPEQAEARRFACAEALLRLTCTDVGRCRDTRCRRSGRCRHLANLHAQQSGAGSRHDARRPPGATALRHAIWVHMNALAASAASEAKAARREQA